MTANPVIGRRSFLKALGVASAALAVPLAWQRPKGKPTKLYRVEDCYITFNGVRCYPMSSAYFKYEPQR